MHQFCDKDPVQWFIGETLSGKPIRENVQEQEKAEHDVVLEKSGLD